MATTPTHADIEAQFTGILHGTITRDQADLWAAQWVTADTVDIDDELVWWGLMHLYGINLSAGPNEPYMHSDEQVAEWLAAFRSGDTDIASGGGAPAPG